MDIPVWQLQALESHFSAFELDSFESECAAYYILEGFYMDSDIDALDYIARFDSGIAEKIRQWAIANSVTIERINLSIHIVSGRGLNQWQSK